MKTHCVLFGCWGDVVVNCSGCRGGMGAGTCWSRPFTPTGNVGAYDWVGKGIQQSLLARP